MKRASQALSLALASAVVLAACARANTAPQLDPPIWSADALQSLRAVAETAPAEGLAPETESLSLLQTLEDVRLTDPEASTRLDTVANALFDNLARSFTSGAIPPATVDPDWHIPPSQPDLAALHAALGAGADPAALLRSLLPQGADYRALRAALANEYAHEAQGETTGSLDQATRILRLRANMERWRWLPRNFPERRIEVRIAQLQMAVYRPGQNPAEHDTIVGRTGSPTPRFVAEMRSITLNPAWEPPSSIIAELLPHFRADPQAAAREGFDVLTRDGAVVPPEQVNWRAPFPYRLRQRPGPSNPLGVVRFNLPNPYAVYLHDTSNRELFNRATRALSHGCVRVENPLSLAETILNDNQWDIRALQEAADEGVTREITLATPIPVYLLYLTATSAPSGAVVYTDDIYNLDTGLVAALDRPEATLVSEQQPRVPSCNSREVYVVSLKRRT